MNVKVLLMVGVTIFCVIGCNDSNENGSLEAAGLIPSSEVSFLQIIQDNGNVPPGEDRYVEYNYSRSELEENMLQAIDEIPVATENLYCSDDGVTYEVNLTDFYGEVFTYVSTNRDCGGEDETAFISIEDIEELLALLNS